MTSSLQMSLKDSCFLDQLATSIADRLISSGLDAPECNLRLRLALEHRLAGGSIPFGLERLNTDDAAAYLGIKAETMRSTAKRRALDLPTPYNFAKKLYWRRSELDAWVERQRERKSAREASIAA
jgi:predicted DNA-binding transcriptional regulator AlpA